MSFSSNDVGVLKLTPKAVDIFLIFIEANKKAMVQMKNPGEYHKFYRS